MGSETDNNQTEVNRPKATRRRMLRSLSLCGVLLGLVTGVYFLLPNPTQPVTQSDHPGTSPSLRERGTLPVGADPSDNELDDPRQDGWDTEVLAHQAKDQLKLLTGLLHDKDKFNPKHV